MTCDDIVVGLNEVIDTRPHAPWRYGTAGAFPNLFGDVWKEECQVFSAEGGGGGVRCPTTMRLGHPDRTPPSVLNRFPVEVLALEDIPTTTPDQQRYWARWMDHCQPVNLPDYVFVMALPKELVVENGLQSKPWRRRYSRWGYEPDYWFLRGHEHGGVVRQDRFVLVLRRLSSKVSPLRAVDPINVEGGPRIARNMLLPTGVPSKAWLKEEWVSRPDYPRWVKEAAAPCLLVGETAQGHTPIFSPDGCLPDSVGVHIQTERGVRLLQMEELAKAKGVPSDWLRQGHLTRRSVNGMTDVHLWTAISASFHRARECQLPAETKMEQGSPSPPVVFEDSDADEWEWDLPDLSAGGEWHSARVASLRAAVKGLPDEAAVFQEGLEALDRHRENYGEEGIQRLQLLWWEFPPEHWETLRTGCPMNFLTTPTEGIVENAPMTEEQVDLAATFIDELWEIGVFELIPDECEMEANCPLFAVPKPGQPGQWRIIADMKSGGQNQHIGKDPVHLPRAKGILERLYTGGWSAVVDASKFFHNFPTHPQDRPYLGCIHPRTGQRLWYLGLPMGSSQSPALGCRYGLALLRLLVMREPVFQGEVCENGWRTKMERNAYRPELGSGLVRIGDDGLPAALLWAFVDDFKIHAPTKGKLIQALNAFMDQSLRLGYICQKVKTKPPTQSLKYCGFIYDTTGIPTLSIPEDKRSRGLAMLQFLRAGDTSQEISRLTLAVVTGLLQSLVDATPQHIGQTYLRRLYDRIHGMDNLTARPAGSAFYYTRVRLSTDEWLDLDWWESALRSPRPVQAYSTQQGALGVSFGDGSGSGTGGTVQVLGKNGRCPHMEAWMGTWRPHVHSFSSNWKELRTLVHTLEREMDGNGRLHQATMFYFTDNLVTYYIVSGGSSGSIELQKLLRRLKTLELTLSIRLEVVHVPGTHMIDQGTDGLSRGIRLGGGRFARTPETEVQRIFEGVPVTTRTVAWARAQIAPLQAHPYVHLMDSCKTWTFSQVSGRATIWFPAPEWAHQLMDGIVSAWTEQPWHTEVFFVVPRVFQRDWGRVSKHILDMGTFASSQVPDYAELTDIPCVLLHLPCYVRSLPPLSGVVPSPRPSGYKWHQEQAEFVRGLS